MARRRKLRHTVSHSTAERCGLGTRGQWPARSVQGVQRIGGGAGRVPRLGVGLSLTWVRPPRGSRLDQQVAADPVHRLNRGLDVVHRAVVVVGRALALVLLPCGEGVGQPAIHHAREARDVDDAVVEEGVDLGHLPLQDLAVALDREAGDGARLLDAVLGQQREQL